MEFSENYNLPELQVARAMRYYGVTDEKIRETLLATNTSGYDTTVDTPDGGALDIWTDDGQWDGVTGLRMHRVSPSNRQVRLRAAKPALSKP